MQIQNNIKIGTHDGTFHCDQVIACVLLSKYSNRFKNAKIIRSRDEKILQQCDIIVDVGGKFLPPKYFDHHQRQFTDTHPNFNIRLSSAGLIYNGFQQLIPNIVNSILNKTSLPFTINHSPESIKEIKNKIYQGFILSVDGNDNGVDICQKKNQMYSINSAIWNRISRCNPMWWEENIDQMERFQQAMKIADQEIVAQVRHLLLGSIQTKSMVLKAFQNRTKYHASGQIVVLEKYFPWQSTLLAIEKELELVGLVKFVIFPEKGNKGWRVQGVPSSQGSFSLRKGLKQEWRGIKVIEELVKISKIQDIVFVHNSGFIGGSRSFESTLKMAQLSL